MTVDESFKKPGSVPFKWEVRPGVPKVQTDDRHQHHRQHRAQDEVRKEPIQSPPRKLKPPPPGLLFFPQEEARSRSFRSAPRARSERWRVDLPMLARPVCVSPGCFPTSPILRRKHSTRSARRPTTRPGPEPEYSSEEMSTPARHSTSSKSSSPFNDTTSSSSYFSFQSSPRFSLSSYLSYRSSPQPAGDPDWAGFGLF